LNRSRLTGWTKPPRTSRRLASPDAETTSDCSGLVEKRGDASFGVADVCGLTVQPLCFWKSVTQSTAGSVDPFSTYPGQARTLMVWPCVLPGSAAVGSLGPGVAAAALGAAEPAALAAGCDAAPDVAAALGAVAELPPEPPQARMPTAPT